MKSCAVIIRTKNRNLLLARAIHSVSKQSYTDWQMVIVNDGGNIKDLEFHIINLKHELNLSNDSICVINNEASVGMEAASNIGIKNSQSRYVVLLDDDDTWEPEFLKKSISTLEANHQIYSGITCHYNQITEKIIDDKINIISSQVKNPNLKYVNFFEMCGENQFTNNSFLYHRYVFDTIGYYDETLPVLGDWEFNLRFLSNYDILVIPEPLVNYHIRKNSVNNNFSNTVTSSISKHSEYRNLLQNRSFRNCVKGESGMGLSMDLVKSLNNLRSDINNINQRINRCSILWQLTKPLRLIRDMLRNLTINWH